MARFAEIAVAVPVQRPFTYRIPAAMDGSLRPGMRVLVPFGKGERPGWCVRLLEETSVPNLKEIKKAIDREPLLDPEALAFLEWVAGYYRATLGEVLDAALPTCVRKRVAARLLSLARPGGSPEEAAAALPALVKRSPAQGRLLQALLAAEAAGERLTPGEIQTRAECGPEALRALKRKGLVRLEPIEPAAQGPLLDLPPPAAPERLFPAQERALAAVKSALASDGFRAFLLEGVPGSGKTEVYLLAMQEAIRLGRQVLFLVPEVALTPQLEHYIGLRVKRLLTLHSYLTDRERATRWEQARRGEADAVLGARSAVFAPLPRLGLIIVDEEQETGYKQANAPRYHARDAAIMRAKMKGIPALLGSATPSLESRENAGRGKYALLKLPERIFARPLPRVVLLDLRREPRLEGKAPLISRALEEAIRERLSRGEQAILFAHRRGFFSFTLCPRCGGFLRCARCDVTLTYHKTENRLLCHLCGATRPPPERCPACEFPGIRRGGFGTERVEEELARLFPGRRIFRMDSDALRTEEELYRAYAKIREGGVDILVGTQMVAKGLHFPNVTLVGVVLADTLLAIPDFRAAERTFNLLYQVAGRAGRGDVPGLVIIQSLQPEQYAVKAAAELDYEAFAREELSLRKRLGYPPFGRLTRLLFTGKDEPAVRARAAKAAQALREAIQGAPFALLGPAPAPIGKIEDRFRFHLLLKGPLDAPAHPRLARAERALVSTDKVSVAVDVDPVSML